MVVESNRHAERFPSLSVCLECDTPYSLCLPTGFDSIIGREEQGAATMPTDVARPLQRCVFLLSVRLFVFRSCLSV